MEVQSALAGWARGGRCAVFLAALFFAAILLPGAARADCQPDPANPGDTVTCAGTDNGGFDGSLVNNLTVNVLAGATVTGLTGGSAITLGDGTAVTNNGTINAGSSGFGISVDINTLVTNNGTINVGDGAIGIYGAGCICTPNTIVNNGLITGTSGVGTSAGILADSFNTVENNGRIVMGDNAWGIAGVFSNTITNNGTIIVGEDGKGVALNPNGDFGANNIFTNNGTVVAGINGFSVHSIGTDAPLSNVVTNNGMLDGRVFLTGFFGDEHLLTNAGLITITNPGTATGVTHFVGGDFVQTANGTLALRVSAGAGGTAGDYDSLLVTGAATLAGTLRAVVQPGLYGTTTTYAGVVTTGCGCVGNFDNVVSSSPFFTATSSINGTDIDLTLTRIRFSQIAGPGTKQQSLGQALEKGYSVALTGNAATFYSNVLAASSSDVFKFLTGEGTVMGQTAAFGSSGLFQSAVSDQIQHWLNNSTGSSLPLGYAPAAQPKPRAADAFAALKPAARDPQPWQTWAGAFGGSQKIEGEASLGTSDASQRGVGGAMGLNYSAGPDFMAGISAGASSSHFSVNGLASSGNQKGIHVGAFAVQSWNIFYLTGTLGYGRFDNDTRRLIVTGGPVETAIGDFSSDLLSGRIEAGWRHKLGAATVTPFAAIDAIHLWQQAYTETSTVAGGGAGVAGLSYRAKEVNSLPISLGVQVDGRIALQNGDVMKPFLRLAWVHEFQPTRSIEASFISVPSVAFTAQGQSAAENAAKLNAGFKLSLSRSAELFLNGDALFAAHSHSYGGSGGLIWSW